MFFPAVTEILSWSTNQRRNFKKLFISENYFILEVHGKCKNQVINQIFNEEPILIYIYFREISFHLRPKFLSLNEAFAL